MRSIISILDQNQVWRGQDGRVYYVAELDDEYLGNIIAFLNRHAERLLDHQRWWDEYHGSPGTSDRVDELESVDALAWLHDRPLYRALLTEQRRRGAVDGEVVPNAPQLRRRMTLDEAMTKIDDEYGDALRELGEL